MHHCQAGFRSSNYKRISSLERKWQKYEIKFDVYRILDSEVTSCCIMVTKWWPKPQSATVWTEFLNAWGHGSWRYERHLQPQWTAHMGPRQLIVVIWRILCSDAQRLGEMSVYNVWRRQRMFSSASLRSPTLRLSSCARCVQDQCIICWNLGETATSRVPRAAQETPKMHWNGMVNQIHQIQGRGIWRAKKSIKATETRWLHLRRRVTIPRTCPDSPKTWI